MNYDTLISLVGLGIMIIIVLILSMHSSEQDIKIEHMRLSILELTKSGQEFMSILHSPNKKGQLGEGIVRMIMRKMPHGTVHEQFTHPKIRGKPDFAIEIGDQYLILDSKFTTLDDNAYLVKRGIEIKKYITPGVTFPFVLMWIPDPAWEELSHDDFIKLTTASVIPVNTSGLVSTIHLVEHFHNVMQLTSKYEDAEQFVNRLQVLGIKRDDMKILFDRGIKQVKEGFVNLKKVRGQLDSFKFD